MPRDGESQPKKNCNGRKYPEILVLGEENKSEIFGGRKMEIQTAQ